MRRHDVGTLTDKQPVKFPDRKSVFDRNYTTDLRYEQRLHTHLFGKVTHVIFAWRHGTGDEQRLALRLPQASRQPDDVLRRSTNVESSDDANDLHSAFPIANCQLPIGL